MGACSQAVPTKISVTQAQLEQGLQGHFPKQLPIAGLLQFEMQQPQLALLPESNQLHTVLKVQLSGSALRATFQGEMQVRFGLVYDGRDRTVRAQRVEVLSLTLPEANPAIGDMVQTYGLKLAQQALQGYALYTVPAQDLAAADKLGLQPGAITVTAQGLDVAIEHKAPSAAQP